MKDAKTTFGTLRLPQSTLSDIDILHTAFEKSYGEKMTNQRFVEQLIASVEDGDPNVWEVFCAIKSNEAELNARINKIVCKK